MKNLVMTSPTIATILKENLMMQNSTISHAAYVNTRITTTQVFMKDFK